MAPRDDSDVNAQIGALLRDLATVHQSTPSAFGYKRAANVILDLDRPIDTLVGAGGTLAKTPNVGPKSERVILEVLRTGGSVTVENAVQSSEHAHAIAKERSLRSDYMSRARVVALLAETTPGLVGLADYRGDFQMHSEWSDGRQTLDDIVAAALTRGYEYSAVTDHSHGLKIARGMSMDDVARQHAEIDGVNRRYAGRFRMIKGIEANILPDGSIDVSADERRHLELVLAAPHSALRSTEDQTARMVSAVRAPWVHVLAHPRGRQYETRAGVQADWPTVFAAALEANVAIEIDGDPWRQDVDSRLARLALEIGCVFALDSDAHSPGELRNAEYAIAHARAAGIPAERVINCWPLDRLLAWLADR